VPKILAAATAIPPYNFPQQFALEYARKHFGPHFGDFSRLEKIYETSRIKNRQFCVPPEWFSSPRSFQEKNDAYIEWACRLGAEAARKCLEMANVAAVEIDYVMFVSTTGLATPSIDARLVNILGLRTDVKRTPIWGLGCAGGAMGITHASDYVKAYPESKVLLVAVELCGLTFQFLDVSKSNLVATALFGDGAAAVLFSGRGDGPEVIGSQSTTWPDSLDVMGWNILNEGMQVVFARAIPAIVQKYARDNFSGLLRKYNMTLDDISHFLIHPGGAKVVDAYKAALCLNEGQLRISEEVLRDHGNMSSVTVLYIIERFMRERGGACNSPGIISALGPGFSSETILFKW
jgi:alkylresorcinol/alkylpyrone synthase